MDSTQTDRAHPAHQQNPAALLEKIKAQVQRVIVGHEDALELMLCALIARGHVLLEDVPGTGKTVMAKTLARALDLTFARIQFTPDLLPGDVTGISVWNAGSGAFEYRRGPVFTHVLLADEINRATPRTQSALLECMAEKQVTADGETRALESPFLVIATQNPVEIQGTFPLPEAQLDRFLMRLKLGYPTRDEALSILDRFMLSDPLDSVVACAGRVEIEAVMDEVPKIAVSGPVREYIAQLTARTRELSQVLLGVSPRGMLMLLRASQALALVRGRAFVTPDDVRSLAVPVMAHRVIVKGSYGRADQSRLMVEEALASVPVPTEA